MNFKPVIPEGQHLGESQQHDGARSGLLYDDETGKLVGHAAWIWVDDEEEDDVPDYHYGGNPPSGTSGSSSTSDSEARPLTEEEMLLAIQLVTLIAVGVATFAVQVKPHVTSFWRRSVKPTINRVLVKLKTLMRRKPLTSLDSDFELLVDDPLEGISTTDLDSYSIVLGEPISMTEAEWQSRYNAMIAAAAFSQEQQRILERAVVSPRSLHGEFAKGTDELTPKEYAARLMPAIVANPELLKPEIVQATAELLDLMPQSAPRALVRRAKN